MNIPPIIAITIPRVEEAVLRASTRYAAASINIDTRIMPAPSDIQPKGTAGLIHKLSPTAISRAKPQQTGKATAIPVKLIAATSRTLPM